MDTFFTKLALSDDRSYRLGRHFIFWFVCWLFMGFIYGFMFVVANQREFIALSFRSDSLPAATHASKLWSDVFHSTPLYHQGKILERDRGHSGLDIYRGIHVAANGKVCH